MKRKRIISLAIVIALITTLSQFIVFAESNWNAGVKINFVPASYDMQYNIPDWLSETQSELGMEAYEELSENDIKWNVFVGPLRLYQHYLKVNNFQILTSNGASISDFEDATTLETGVPKSEAEILKNLGILSGVEEEDGKYMYMQKYVKRGEVAKILATFYEKILPDTMIIRGANDFDDTYDHWAKPYIDYCYQRGILDGKSDFIFDPEGYVTKAESIKILCNMANGENFVLIENVAKAINETYKCTTIYDESNNLNSSYGTNNSTSNNIVITPKNWSYTVLPNNTISVEVECSNKYRKLEFNKINSNIDIVKTSSSSGKYILNVKGIYEGVGFISCTTTSGTSNDEVLYIPIFVKGYNANRASNINIKDSNISLNVGNQYLLSNNISITPNSASYNGIYFSSTDPNIASVNYLTGQIIAKSSGTCYINVITYGISKRVKVKVLGYNYNYNNYGYNYNTKYLNLSVNFGKTLDLKNYITSIGYNTSYYSNNTGIATVSSNGIITGRSVGSTKIVVSSGYNQYIVNVLVRSNNSYYDYEIQNIGLINNSISILEEEEYDMYDNIYIYPENANMSGLKFYSENTSIAEVGKRDGVVIGKQKGITRIRIVCNNITRYCTIYVGNRNNNNNNNNNVSVTDIVVNLPNNNISLSQNESYYLVNDITVYPTNATNKKVYYSSSNENVVKVDNSGNLTAISRGNATITVRAGNVSKVIYVTVTENEVVPDNTPTQKTLQFLSKDPVQIGVGLDFNPYALLNITSGVTFSLSDYSIAKIENNRVIGIKEGNVTLTATYNGSSDTIQIVVK